MRSMRLPAIILLIASIIIGSSCAVSKYSNKKKKEDLAIGVDENSEAINYALFEQQQVPDLASRGGKDRGITVGAVLSYAWKGVKAFINMDSKKYTAAYKQQINDLYFYDQLSTQSAFDPVGMQFNGFSLLRTIVDKHGERDTAIYAAFELDTDNPYEIINNSYFRLKVKEVQLNYTKAKVASKKWYVPGFMVKNPDKLNIDIEITFRASWVTENGQLFDNMEIGKFYLNLRDMPVKKGADGYSTYFASLKGVKLDGKCPLIPRSYGYYYYDLNQLRKCYGQGLYSIDVDVKESGSMNFIYKVVGEKGGINVEK